MPPVLLHMNDFFFVFLIVCHQGCTMVRLFVGFEIFKIIFQEKKQSMTMFHCLRLGTILVVRQ